jgi:hypothetical protein
MAMRRVCCDDPAGPPWTGRSLDDDRSSNGEPNNLCYFSLRGQTVQPITTCRDAPPLPPLPATNPPLAGLTVSVTKKGGKQGKGIWPYAWAARGLSGLKSYVMLPKREWSLAKKRPPLHCLLLLGGLRCERPWRSRQVWMQRYLRAGHGWVYRLYRRRYTHPCALLGGFSAERCVHHGARARIAWRGRTLAADPTKGARARRGRC